ITNCAAMSYIARRSQGLKYTLRAAAGKVPVSRETQKKFHVKHIDSGHATAPPRCLDDEVVKIARAYARKPCRLGERRGAHAIALLSRCGRLNRLPAVRTCR